MQVQSTDFRHPSTGQDHSRLKIQVCLVAITILAGLGAGCAGVSQQSSGGGQTYNLSGQVTPTAAGSGATLTLSGAAGGTAVADSSGNFSFTGLSNGTYVVTPSHKGYSFTPATQTVTINGSNQSLPAFAGTAQTLGISGTITGGAGVTVTLSGTANASTTADGSGNFSFTGLASGNYAVTPVKTGVTFTPASKAVIITTASVTGVDFTSSVQTFSISGTISGTGGETVTLSGQANGSTTADGSGNFSFTGLANGSYTVTPSKIGFTFSPASKPVTINNANASGVDFTATALIYSISGTISGVGGAKVTLTGAANSTTTANGSGVYGFTGLANGSYTVTPTLTGYVFAPTSKTVSISGASLSGVNFAATAVKYSISGTISGGAGSTVTLSGAASSNTTADGSGNYSFTNLLNGIYAITPGKTGYTFNPTSQPVTINGANVTGVNFTATVAPPTYTISGNISPASVGSGVVVTLSGAASGSTSADSNGNFSFTSLSNGAYTVTPSSTTATFAPTSQNVSINGASVSGVGFTATATSNVIFFDDFTGTSLDATNWVALDRHGDYGNGELQCYLPANVSVANSLLSIVSQVQTQSCGDADHAAAQWNYTSAMVQWTSFNFTYGTVEYRAKMAGGQGTWPAIWLLGANCQASNVASADNSGKCNWPQPGSDEIDITEIKGGNLTTVWQNVISGSSGFQTCTPTTADVSQNWHVYQLVWEAGSLIWKIDGTQTCKFTSSIPSNPMFLMINTAVGGQGGGTVVNGSFPQTLQVDYVKVTQPQ